MVTNGENARESGGCLACLRTLVLVNGLVPPHPGPVGTAYEGRCIGSNKLPMVRPASEAELKRLCQAVQPWP